MEAAELKEITDGLAAAHAEIKQLIEAGEQKHEERVVALSERIGAPTPSAATSRRASSWARSSRASSR